MFQKFFTRRRAVLTQVFASLFLAATLVTVAAPVMEQQASAARTRAAKYEVCHRTNAVKNPYRLISVAWSSVNPDGNGHDNPVHDGPVFDIANPVASHGSTPRDSGLGNEAGGGNDRWGDIFNAVRGQGQSQSNSNNWTTAGQAIFNGATFTIGGVTKAACRKMSAVDYIRSEREENPNKPMSDIMAELDDMDASEDVALKQSLGGSFTSWFTSCNPATTDCENTTVISASIQAKMPSVTTEPPTAVSTGTTTNTETATLNGTISPQGVSMVWYFEFDDDTDFTPSGSDATDVQEVPGTPGTSNSSSTVPVSFNATGLNHTKTYYYRTVGVATSGSGDTLVETYLYGVTRQFSYGAPAAPTISSITCGNGSLSVAFTAGAANGGTITNYQYSINGGDSFITLATPSTTSPISITGLTNGTEYSVSIRAITSTKTGADSATVAATPCGTPGSTTTPATNVQPTTATLNGHLTGNGNALASISFTWGTSATLASGNTITNANTTSLAGTADTYPVFANITGLTGGTTYYFRVSGTYSNGQSTTQGSILSFVTPAAVVPPVATTDPASNVQETTATLNGTGTSNGASSTITFTWGTSSTLASGNTTTAATQSPLSSGATSSPVTLNLTGLTGGITYYFRVTITNTNGTANGIIRSFVTTAPTTTTTTSPPATTVAPSNVTGALRGIVWIDRNLNEVKDSDEPGIPFTPLVATLISSSIGGTPGTKLTFTSDAEGKYSVPTLEPGNWEVTASLITDALARTFDSDSRVVGQSAGGVSAQRVRAAAAIDWKASTTVPVNGLGVADFAAAGDSALKVKVDIPVECVKSNSVEITWAGYDLKLGTKDDATFVVAIKDQEAAINRIPYGAYSVTPICTSGVKLTSQQVVLQKSKSQAVTVTPKVIPSSLKGLTLPTTGQRHTQDLNRIGVLLIALGAVLVSRKRIRRA